MAFTTMRLLYKAYACENDDDGNSILLPGFPMQGDTKQVKPGELLHVELADGTRLQTAVVATQYLTFEESAAERLRTKPGFYCAIKVPRSFSLPGIALGVDIYVEH
jgi:hypothetical protein